jgi:antitoxin MazE
MRSEIMSTNLARRIVERAAAVSKPVTAPSYDLDDLLERMTPETFPEEIDVGPPLGREAW